MSKISYQGQIDWIETRCSYAASTYTDMQMLELNIELTPNHYINFSNMVLCLPITFRKRTNKANPIAATMIPVNNFFAHWIKDVTVKRFRDDIAVLPINTTLDIYRYSESMLKYLPDDVLVTFQKDLLYSKNKVIIKGNATNTLNDRRNHIAAAANDSEKVDNIDNRIAKFNENSALSKIKVFRIPLRYLVDLGIVNLPTAFDVKLIFNLEQNLRKLFESKAKLPNVGTAAAALPTTEPDANVYWHTIPYIQYEQVKLNDTFNKYIVKAVQSKRVLRTGIKPTPFQKSFEVNVAELAATHTSSVQLENLNNKYGEINKKYDLTDEHNKYMMYRNFVAWATGQGSSVGPLTQYANNEIYKELIKYEDYYNKKKSDEKLYVDLRRGRDYTVELEKVVRNDLSLTLTITLKDAAVKKMRLRVVGYYQGEYIYSMTNLGLLLSYKDYGIVAQNEMVALAA